MVFSHPRPSDPPPLIEALAVWGWAVEHGGIPLPYAADVLSDHPSYVTHSGVDNPTKDERTSWALEDLEEWENTVVHMDWPGDDAIDEERWDQDAYWQLRDYVLRSTGRTESTETTTELLRNYLADRIAECEQQSTGEPNAPRPEEK